MSRQEYEAIAKAFREAARHEPYLTTPEQMRLKVATLIADIMAQDNPRFERSKFLIACAADMGPPR